MEIQYQSALVTFLDRDSQTVQISMLHPITRVVLQEFDGSAVKVTRVFIVNDDGKWAEAA